MAKKGLKEALDKKLKVYSAAAVGVLALAPSVDAAIQYNGPKNLPVDPSHYYDIDLNGDSTADFRFAYEKWFSSSGSWGKGEYLKGQYGAGHIWGGNLYCSDAIRLASNYQVRPTLANALFHWVANYWIVLTGPLQGKQTTVKETSTMLPALLACGFIHLLARELTSTMAGFDTEATRYLQALS